MKNLFTPPRKRFVCLISFCFMLLGQQHVQAQSLEVQLSPSLYNGGYHISCYDAADGSISVSISNGTPPYTFVWSNDATTQNISNLSEGYYSVEVRDANDLIATKGINLIQPRNITVEVTSPYYPNGYNISCFGCFNGQANTIIDGGVAPYQYMWSSGHSTAQVSGLGPGGVDLMVSDANNCTGSGGTDISEPERDDWTMQGNSNSNANTDFMGTTDNTDFVLRTSNTERIRVAANGDLLVNSLAGNAGMLMVDSSGRLLNPNSNIQPCGTGGSAPAFLIDQAQNLIYTCSNTKLGIGVGYNYLFPADYGLVVEGKIGAREVHVRANGQAWPDYVFDKDYTLMPLPQVEQFINKNKHLPGMPVAKQIESDGMELSKIITLQQEKIEELYLYVIELEKRIKK